MNIAFFSECWDPQINGVVTSTKALINSLDHGQDRVSVFAPYYPSYTDTYPAIFRQPAIRYFFQPEFFFSSPLPHAAIRRARRWDVELVHMHTEFTLGMAGIRVARALAVPAVLTLHTLWEHYNHYFFWGVTPRNLVRRTLSLLYTGPDYFIAPTQKAKDYLTDTLGVTKPVTIIPTGIDLAAFTAAGQNAERERLRAAWGVAPSDTLHPQAPRRCPRPGC